MRRVNHFFAAAIMASGMVLLPSDQSTAAVPSLVNYQGILTNPGGTPEVGTFSVTFNIYDSPSSGAAIWSEGQNITTNSDGLFNVLLGSSVPLTESVFSGTDCWLGVVVPPGAELTPRTRIVTVAYAFRAATVDGATGGNITSKVSIGTGHTNSGNDAFVAGVDNQVSANYSAVGGGALNNASGESSVISGGQQSTSSGFASTVAGGASNTSSNAYSAVGGGLSNTSSGFGSLVDGGAYNDATNEGAVVGGGRFNHARGQYSTIGGGGGSADTDSNLAIGPTSTVAGGSANTASGTGSSVGGGYRNAASGGFTAIGGGEINSAGNFVATVAGGQENTASGFGSAIGGGRNNIAANQDAVVSGGQNNTASALGSTVAGGRVNTASGSRATVGGGQFNKAHGQFSVVAGGGGALESDSNSASGPNSTIGGGRANDASGDRAVVGGGSHNIVSASGATVPGGVANEASGSGSFAAGYLAKARHANTFVWSNGGLAEFASTGIHQFLINADGGVGIGTNAPGKALQIGDESTNGAEGMIRLESRSISGASEFRNWDIGVPVTLNGTTGKAYDFVIDDTQLGIEPEAVFQFGSGYLGLGVLDPAYRIELPNNADASGQGRANAWTTYSSRRWKANIEPITGALAKVERLRGVEYDNKSDGGHSIGLIAEEVGAVIPEVVQYERNGTDAMSLDYARLTALLIEAVKEQQRTIEAQQADIEDLKITIKSMTP